ncbi:hypothetical protein RhiirA4_472385 [Rhizophagus irregularis]|uniref:Uncharacterized protein n=1 Tax=Rhizophagus irregularis TaxID=588596 RepID=A0A2I1H4U9_9GLOM|nr:hypothetical protein RhiirA4_472385 [Rhizophagus irregularis]
MSTLKQSRALRKKGKASESVNQSLVNHRKLAYNILKNLEDDILGEKEISELDKCSECNNEILASPPKEFTKKLALTEPNTCPFPDCGKNVDIIKLFPTNQKSPISALSNKMNKSLAILSSPILRIEGVENTGSQSPPKPLVYLTCKHIVHYACIDNPRRLYPICPSANNIEQHEEEEEMDVDEKENDDQL